MMNSEIVKNIAELKSMNTDQLRKRWLDVFSQLPPQVGKTYLHRRIAYRLQELAFGCDEMIEKRLEGQAKIYRINQRKADARMHKPIAGSKLLRTYKGVEHQIIVLPDGFEYKGKHFKSLTKIACEITGTWISGPVFFGLTLRKKAGEK